MHAQRQAVQFPVLLDHFLNGGIHGGGKVRKDFAIRKFGHIAAAKHRAVFSGIRIQRVNIRRGRLRQHGLRHIARGLRQHHFHFRMRLLERYARRFQRRIVIGLHDELRFRPFLRVGVDAPDLRVIREQQIPIRRKRAAIGIRKRTGRHGNRRVHIQARHAQQFAIGSAIESVVLRVVGIEIRVVVRAKIQHEQLFHIARCRIQRAYRETHRIGVFAGNHQQFALLIGQKALRGIADFPQLHAARRRVEGNQLHTACHIFHAIQPVIRLNHLKGQAEKRITVHFLHQRFAIHGQGQLQARRARLFIKI